jgi:hypothetical protein
MSRQLAQFTEWPLLVSIRRRTSALLGLLLWVGKADIGRACRLAGHFQLACLNLSHGLKWRAGRGRLQWTYHAIRAFVWNASNWSD